MTVPGRPDRLPWWDLPVPTAQGRHWLSCHVPDPRHYAARVPDDVIAPCDICHVPQRGHVWASPDQTTVMCGPCHNRRHAAGNLPDPDPDAPTGDQIPGQMTL